MSLPKINSDRLVKTFLELVQIDSPSRKEAPVADYLEKHLADLSVKFWRDDAGEKIDGNCGNLIVRMEGNNSSAPAILFSAHMDTVMPGLGIKPQIDNGVIRSDGTTILGADDKAGIAAVLEMMRVLRESKIPHGPVEVIFDVAEEVGLLGANQVDKSSMEAECAIVLDAEDMDTIVYKSPSANRMVYEIEGFAAHAGMAPEKGISAIQIFAEAVSEMDLGRIDEETTANIGKVEAGSATNIVTPYLKAHAECRSHSEEKLEHYTNAMSKAFRDAVKKFTREIDGQVKTPVFKEKITKEFTRMNVDFESLPFRLAKASGEMLGIDMKPIVIGGGTNASAYFEKGLPSVIIGCGMKEEHTTSEHVSIQDLEIAAKLCLGILIKNHEFASQ